MDSGFRRQHAHSIKPAPAGFFMPVENLQAKKNRPKPVFFLKLILLRSSRSRSSWCWSSSGVRSGWSSSGWSSSVSCWSGWSSSWSWSSSFWSSYWSWSGRSFFFFRASSQSHSQQGGDQQGFFHGFSLVNSKLNTVLRLIITGNYRSLGRPRRLSYLKRCLLDNGNFLAEYYSDF